MRSILLALLVSLPVAALAQGPPRIVQRTVTFQRGKPGQPFPDFKRATIRYPEIEGLSDPAVLRKANEALSVRAATGDSLEKMRKEFAESYWLSSMVDKVLLNQRQLVSIVYVMEGVGAYPSTTRYFLNVDLRTGAALTPQAVFRADRVASLVGRLDALLQSEIRRSIRSAQDPEAVATLKRELDRHRFKAEDLKRFSLDGTGLTFHYDYDFAHVILALRPAGELRLSYRELRSDIRADGPLARMR